MEVSSDYNKFLSTQLKIQKAREGFEVKLLTPIEFSAILYLTYDLQQFMIKPTGAYPAFDAIVIPILSITSMTTPESSSPDSSPVVNLRLTLPPFAVSISFPSDCRSFSSFVESIEFLRMTLGQSHMTQAQREIFELRKTNEQMQATIETLHATKLQQDQVIQELSRLMKTMATPDTPPQVNEKQASPVSRPVANVQQADPTAQVAKNSQPQTTKSNSTQAAESNSQTKAEKAETETQDKPQEEKK